MTAGAALTARDHQRLETQERVFSAAVEVIREAGLAAADVRAIVERAGVARGTFYFHFPTKQDVLVELQRREQEHLVDAVRRSSGAGADLPTALRAIVEGTLAMEERLGAGLFRDMISVNFGQTSALAARQADNRVVAYLVEVATDARAAGALRDGVDPVEVAAIALTALFGLLATASGPSAGRDGLAERCVDVLLHGVAAA